MADREYSPEEQFIADLVEKFKESYGLAMQAIELDPDAIILVQYLAQVKLANWLRAGMQEES